MRPTKKGRGCSKLLLGSHHRSKIALLLLIGSTVLTFFLLSIAAHGDEVVLTNGDRISGKIIKLSESKLTLETAYTKSLEIGWPSVKGASIDTPAEIVLKDGTRLKGTAQIVTAGGVKIITESAGEVAIGDLSLIRDINPPAAITYKGNAQAAGSLNSGNTKTLAANLSGDFVARSERQRLTLRALYNYGEDRNRPGGNVQIQNASGSIKYDFFATKKLYTYVNSLLEHDQFQDLSLRSTIGGGLGYQFFESKRTALAFELGVSYLDENFYVADDKAYASGRWSINFSYQLVPDKISLFHFQEGYFGFDDLKNLYLKTQQGIRFTVIKNFFAALQANVNFNNAPSPGFQKVDTTLLFGLGYTFDL